MAEAGCERVKIGFESGSNRILSEVKKLETREEMLKGAEMLKRAGVPFSAYFMAGFPGETDDDLKETIDFAKKVDADYYSLSVLAPYYGTELYDQLMKELMWNTILVPSSEFTYNKILVPTGSPWLLINTAAFVSNLMVLPSTLFNSFLVLTITAL